MTAAEVARLGYEGLKTNRPVVIAGMFNTVMATSSWVGPHSLSMAIGDYPTSHHPQSDDHTEQTHS